jgi:hypothetical protein
MTNQNNQYYNQKYFDLKNQLIIRYKCCVITGAPPNVCDIVYIQPLFRLTKSKYDIDNCLLLRYDLINLYNYNQIKICPNTLKIKIDEPYYASFNNRRIYIHKDSVIYLIT